MKQLVIIGASGHGRVVADIAKLNGYTDIIFLDDDETLKHCDNYEVVGRSSDVQSFDADVFIAIGNAEARRKAAKLAEGKLITLVHPDAVIADGVYIGTGTVIMAGAVVNPGSRIGKGCIINTSSSIDHDCKISDFVHIAVGAHLSGTVSIGDNAWIGAGATVSNNVTICSRCMIGAGTVVVKDIEAPGTYVGVPARKVEGGLAEVC